VLPTSSQYAVAPLPAVQVKVTLLPVKVEPGAGEVIVPFSEELPKAV
jgi:hypothetical protein